MKTFFIYFLLLVCIGEIAAQAPDVRWEKSLGGSYTDRAQSVIELEDGGYVIAGNSQSIDHDLSFNLGEFDWWIIRINKERNIVWKKSLGGTSYDYVRQVIQTADGNFLCIGETISNNGDITGYIGAFDFWVAKIDTLGNILWNKCYGGLNLDFGYSACNAADGNIMLAGMTQSGYPHIEFNHG